MKETYIAPAAEVIDLFIESPILTDSPELGTFSKPGASNESAVLSNKTIWNYNEGNEK